MFARTESFLPWAGAARRSLHVTRRGTVVTGKRGQKGQLSSQREKYYGRTVRTTVVCHRL